MNETGSRDDELFMKQAIALARAAAAHGNEPFGALLVREGTVVCTSENRILTRHDPTFHAELGLIRRFCGKSGVTDLGAFTMYASCEPCFMCSGAIVRARLGRLVYAASSRDLSRIRGKEGCDCSRIVFECSGRGPEVRAGVLREQAVEVLEAYFGAEMKEKEEKEL